MLSALSFALDRVEGQPEGHAVRSCFVGMTVAGRLGLTEEERSALFYVLLPKDAGCSSNASRMSTLFDADDLAAKRAVNTVDWTNPPRASLYAARTVSPEGNLWRRTERFLTFAVQGESVSRRLIQIRCEWGAELTRLMGFPEATALAIRSLDEHVDGRGHPDGLKDDEIPLLARICGLAQTVEVFYNARGPAEAEEVARVRRGRWFAPVLVDLFLAEARDGGLWEGLEKADLWHEVSRLEPADRVVVATPERLDLVSRAFAEIIDAKSPFTYRHSEGVAEVAVGERLGFDADARRDLLHAGLLHDIGKLGVSNRILDKPDRLTGAEFAKVKKHPGLTHEILSRIMPFRGIADTAANHHERLDGSGYHRGLTSDRLDLPSRILAVADVYDALTRDRPYREALPREKAPNIIGSENGENLCPTSVAALGELAGEDVR